MEAKNFFSSFPLLFLLSFNTSVCDAQDNWIVLEYANAGDSLSEEIKNKAYLEYMKCKEGNWLYFQFKNVNNITESNYADSKKMCLKLSDLFTGKGLAKEDVLTRYSTVAHLVVYKKPGIIKNANFVSLPKEWKQTFVINNKYGGVCETKFGHVVVFEPYSFETIKGDSVSIEVYEIDSKKKFIQSGYTATSGEKMLESNGMFKLTALQGDQQIAVKSGSEAQILYKTEDFENPEQRSTYSTFYGTEKKNKIDWKLNANQKISNTPKKEEVVKLPKNGVRMKSTSTYSMTEIHYVQLCRKIALLEPGVAASMSGCQLNQTDYDFLVSKYGAFTYKADKDLPEIKSYQQYLELSKSEPEWIFIGLTNQQKENLKKDETAKRIKDEAKRVAEEKAQKEREIAEEKARKIRELAEEKERKEKELAAAKAQAIIDKHPISLKINQLGNINCDRFYDVKEKTDIIVKLSENEYDQIRVYAIFSDIKSVINGSYLPNDKGNITFCNLPQGKNVIYLAAIFKGNEVKMAYISKPILVKDVVNLSLKSYTTQQYDKILGDLIPN